MRRILLVLTGAAVGFAGCADLTGERSAYVTLTEVFGAQDSANGGSGGSGGSGGGSSATDTFRADMTVTIANGSADFDANVYVAAWVSPSSIRSADQQDALFRSGYVQLSREVTIGTAYTLPPGTFVLGGPGIAGAQKYVIAASGGTAANPVAPATESFTITTPDVLLFFQAPPVACDTPAFYFTEQGRMVDSPTFGGGFGEGTIGGSGSAIGSNSENFLPIKTLRQIPGYECDPLRPGFFLKVGGGAKLNNEYFEGENVTITLLPIANAAGEAAIVQIGN